MSPEIEQQPIKGDKSSTKSSKSIILAIGIVAVVVVAMSLAMVAMAKYNSTIDFSQESQNQDKLTAGVGGIAKVGNASLTYPVTWFEVDKYNSDVITVTSNDETESVVLGITSSDWATGLDDFAQTVTDRYSEGGIILPEPQGYQEINGIEWKHTRIHNHDAWCDFWFYASDDLYYMLIYENFTEAGEMTDASRAIVNSVTIGEAQQTLALLDFSLTYPAYWVEEEVKESSQEVPIKSINDGSYGTFDVFAFKASPDYSLRSYTQSVFDASIADGKESCGDIDAKAINDIIWMHFCLRDGDTQNYYWLYKNEDTQYYMVVLRNELIGAPTEDEQKIIDSFTIKSEK